MNRTMKPATLIRSLGAAGAVGLLLGACAGAPTRIHTLSAAPPATALSAGFAGAPFRVDAVHIPPAFDRPELIRRTDAYSVTLSDTDRWAAPLGELIRRALTQDLAARLAPGVVIFPDAPKPAGARGLVVDILSVTPSANGVDMEVSWTWLAAKGPVSAAASGAQPPPAVLPPTTVRLSTTASGAGAEAVAPELSALLGLLADRIAAGG